MATAMLDYFVYVVCFVAGSWFGYAVACLMRGAARPRGWQPQEDPDKGPINPPPPPRSFADKGGRNDGASYPKPVARPHGQGSPLVRVGQGSYTVDYTPGARQASVEPGQSLDVQA